MKVTAWMGEYRELIEYIIGFANNYASVQSKEFMGTDIKYSFAQIQVVEYLLEKEDRNYKMAEVANRLGITASSFTKLVNKLVDKGVLQKYHIKGNRKDIIVQVTEEGKRIYQEYVDTVAKKVFAEFFEVGKDISEEEIVKFAQMMRSLHKIEMKDKEPVILESIE